MENSESLSDIMIRVSEETPPHFKEMIKQSLKDRGFKYFPVLHWGADTEVKPIYDDHYQNFVDNLD